MTNIKEGSKWVGNDDRVFRVMHTIELDGHTWVHYREDSVKKPTLECKEYSCYLDSFTARFRSIPE